MTEKNYILKHLFLKLFITVAFLYRMFLQHRNVSNDTIFFLLRLMPLSKAKNALIDSTEERNTIP